MKEWLTARNALSGFLKRKLKTTAALTAAGKSDSQAHSATGGKGNGGKKRKNKQD